MKFDYKNRAQSAGRIMCKSCKKYMLGKDEAFAGQFENNFCACLAASPSEITGIHKLHGDIEALIQALELLMGAVDQTIAQASRYGHSELVKSVREARVEVRKLINSGDKK